MCIRCVCMCMCADGCKCKMWSRCFVSALLIRAVWLYENVFLERGEKKKRESHVERGLRERYKNVRK